MKSNSVARLVNGSHVCITDRHFDHTCNIAMILNALFCAVDCYKAAHVFTLLLLLLVEVFV